VNDEALWKLSDGPRDDQLKVTDNQLQLPRGAFIAFRQSGGLRFSMREVIVYSDGRVTYRQQGKLSEATGTREISQEAVAELQAVLDQSGFFDLPASIGRSSPDGYAYEILARARRKTKQVEAFTGSVPVALQPMIRQLQKLMQTDE
jgi:hypothetical protein